MAILGMALLIVGVIIMFAGAIWLLVVEFQESVGWGLACFFISPIHFLFVILHWDKAKKPFLCWLAGWVPVIVGSLVTGQGLQDLLK